MQCRWHSRRTWNLKGLVPNLFPVSSMRFRDGKDDSVWWQHRKTLFWPWSTWLLVKNCDWGWNLGFNSGNGLQKEQHRVVSCGCKMPQKGIERFENAKNDGHCFFLLQRHHSRGCFEAKRDCHWWEICWNFEIFEGVHQEKKAWTLARQKVHFASRQCIAPHLFCDQASPSEMECRHLGSSSILPWSGSLRLCFVPKTEEPDQGREIWKSEGFGSRHMQDLVIFQAKVLWFGYPRHGQKMAKM